MTAGLLAQAEFIKNVRIINIILINLFKVKSVQQACAKCFAVNILKGVFSKPSGKLILGPDFCLLS